MPVIVAKITVRAGKITQRRSALRRFDFALGTIGGSGAWRSMAAENPCLVVTGSSIEIGFRLGLTIAQRGDLRRKITGCGAKIVIESRSSSSGEAGSSLMAGL